MRRILLLVCAWLPVTAAAATIWDNGGPLVGGSAADISGFVVADDFTLTDPTALTNLTFWARTNEAGEPFSVDFTGTVGWALYADSGGIPGAEVATGDDTGPIVTNTGLLGTLGAEIHQLDVMLSTPLLNPGTYWLGLRNGPFGSPDPSGGVIPDKLFWQFSQTRQGQDLVADSNLVNPTTWGATLPVDLAFRLEGNVIPEPSTMALVGSAAIVLALRRRRR